MRRIPKKLGITQFIASIIGTGSMGSRRMRDLTLEGCGLFCFDSAYGVPFDAHRDLEPEFSDLIIVSTPPLTKRPYVEAASEYGIPCFTEADVEFIDAPHLPSATPLFTEWYAGMRRRKGLVTKYVHRTGQHIDDWHPGSDRETYYGYRDNLAIREMFYFELIWLTKMFGSVTDVKRYEWEPGDEASAKLTHSSGVTGKLTIDLISRPAIREFLADTWDAELTYTEADYLAEMHALLAAVKGEQPWPYTQEEERANLEVLHTIEHA